MAMTKFETSDSPHIALRACAGDLTITGGDVRAVIIEVDGEETNLTAQREGEAIFLTALEDCSIVCPPGTSITVQQAAGDMHVRGVEGSLVIEAAMGDLSLRGVGGVDIRSAVGDLEVRQARGDVTLNQVNGDVHIRNVEGKLVIEQCNGDLSMRDVLGGLEVKEARGDVGLAGVLTPGKDYRARVTGDVKLRFPTEASARCTFEASGSLRCGLVLADGEKGKHRVTGQLGTGEALVEVYTQGDLTVKSDDQAARGEFEYVTTELEAELAEMERRLHKDLAGLEGLGTHISEKVHRKTEKVAERARQAAERAAEHARRMTEKEAERARRRTDRRASGFSFRWGGPPAPPRSPAADLVSDQERLKILRMVEEKKISASDAALLLEALEGRG